MAQVAQEKTKKDCKRLKRAISKNCEDPKDKECVRKFIEGLPEEKATKAKKALKQCKPKKEE